MCHYCGCRQIRLIRDYIAEHDRALELGDRAVRAVAAGDLDAAQESVRAMHAELRKHWPGEENGVFAVLMYDDLYRSHLEPLMAEHRVLDDLLAGLDVHRPADQVVLREQLDELREHISREEDGIFPATLVELDGEEWERAVAGWQAAHPGEELITD